MSTMDSEQFFLKWNNFESNLASGFSDLLESEAMVDVTLAAEGRIVQAHKIILSVCSSYFKNMFQVNPCQHPIVFLKDVRYQELTDMLDFMYKGEANVRQEDLPAFLKLAETLEVKGLAGTSDSEENKKGGRDEEEEKLVNNSLVNNSCPPSYFSRENFVEKMPFVPKKKPKRCGSPISYSESGSLVQSPVIKLERECESGVEDSSTNNEISIVKEERFSDNSCDYYVENVDECLEKKAGPSSVEDNPDPTAPDLWSPRRTTKPLSVIWSFFNFDCLENKSECKLCGKIFKASPKTGTASVKYHLHFAHQILRNDGGTQ